MNTQLGGPVLLCAIPGHPASRTFPPQTQEGQAGQGAQRPMQY